jgi:hypothetical protein
LDNVQDFFVQIVHGVLLAPSQEAGALRLGW